MAKTIKMADMPANVALEVFKMLNAGNVGYYVNNYDSYVVVTDEEPKDLVYPEGWHYAKGCFRNKHMTSGKQYTEIEMRKGNGEPWRKSAGYCTLYD